MRRLFAAVTVLAISTPVGAEDRWSKLDQVTIDASSSSEIIVRLVGSKAPDFTTTTLRDPFRVVVEWSGSKLGGVPADRTVGPGLLRKIHARQFKQESEEVSRVTLELARETEFKLEAQGNTVVVRLKKVEVAPPEPVASASPSASPSPSPVAVAEKAPDGPLTEPALPPVAPPKPVAPKPAPPKPVVAAVVPPAPAPKPAPVVSAAPVAPKPVASTTPIAAALPPIPSASPKPVPAAPSPSPTPVVLARATPPAPAPSPTPVTLARLTPAAPPKAEPAKVEPAKPEPKIATAPPPPVKTPQIAAAPAPIPAPAPTQTATDFDAGPRVLTYVGFRQKASTSEVFIRLDARARYKVIAAGPERVILELYDTHVNVKNNTRALDTSFFESAVTRVQAVPSGKTTKVEIDLRETVPYEVKRIGSTISLEFKLPSA